MSTSKYPENYPIVQARDLVKHFPMAGGRKLVAVDGISIDLVPGKTIAVVGESGSGKSTLARCIMRLTKVTSGDVLVHGQSIVNLDPVSISRMYRHLQMVFQDPNSSLNPRMTVRQLVHEPMRLHLRLPRKEREIQARELMGMVGLTPAHLDRYPHELSGGQRQRIGIARALAIRPEVLVLDEPTASLDVSVRGQILELLTKVQREMDLAYLLISHDLHVVRHVADEVVVMYLGVVVEQARTEDLFTNPRHPYTRALLSAAPVAEWGVKHDRLRLAGEINSPVDPPDACRLVGRCPFQQPSCAAALPPLVKAGPGHLFRCPVVASEGPVAAMALTA